MATVPQYHNMEDGKEKIALANIVRPLNATRYTYIATRVYDAVNDTVTDEVMWIKGAPNTKCNESDFSCALWRDLPAIDIETKQLVGKNKEKYCTLLSIRTYGLGRASADTSYDRKSIVSFYDGSGGSATCYQTYHILGYTFIDVNGDKVYLTVPQLRKSDILQHTHSMERVARIGGLYNWLRNKTAQAQKATCVTPLLERAEEDIVAEDSEIEELEVYKFLTGSWYTISPSGTLKVDRAALEAAQFEAIEIPTGVRCIPYETFMGIPHIKRIKLPETLYEIGSFAFKGMPNLEEVNIPSQVKKLDRVFDECHKLKHLDLSGVESLCTMGDMSVDHLVLPDVLPEVSTYHSVDIGVLEFRNVQGVKHRVLKAQHRAGGAELYVKKIITNGPVVLGSYGVAIYCADVSELEPNIVGIAPNSSFYRVDNNRNQQPLTLGPRTEFIYEQWRGNYSLTEDAYAANKLRVAYVSEYLDIKLPKSVEILQGELSESMRNAEYPNVVYASSGLCHPKQHAGVVMPKLPALRWILPEGKVLTEAQIKRLEKKLTPILSEMCKDIQETCKVDITKAESLNAFKAGLLVDSIAAAQDLLSCYGMIYVGDYSEVLRGK